MLISGILTILEQMAGCFIANIFSIKYAYQYWSTGLTLSTCAI